MTTSPVGLQYTFVELTNMDSHPYCILLNRDPREIDFAAMVDSRVAVYGRIYHMNPEHIRLIQEKISSGAAVVLYALQRTKWWTADDIPFHFHRWLHDHPFQVNDDWAGTHILADSISVTYDTDGEPHLTVAADVRFINANAPYIPAPAPIPPTPPVPGTEPHWGVRRLMVHNITQRLEEAAVQFTNEMQFYWSGQDATRFWATERQLTSWIAMVREHLAILAAGNTTHTVSVEVGTPFDLGRPVHQIPILEALPWMMDQLEIMMSEGVLHFFDFHPDVLHAELGIFPSKPTYFLWGVDGAGLASRRMVREIIVLDWAATRKFEYAAARRGDPVPYTQNFAEKLHSIAKDLMPQLDGLSGTNADTIRTWYKTWIGYASLLDSVDAATNKAAPLVPVSGATSTVTAGEHAVDMLEQHSDPQVLHDALDPGLVAKLTARELWGMDDAGILASRLDVAHTQTEWDLLAASYYTRATVTRD